MAIALDSANAGSNQTGTSLSFSHTCTGTNLILFVSFKVIAANVDDITSVTYNSIAMTLVNKVLQPTNNNWMYLYHLIAPSSGANNVTVNSTSSTQKVMYGVSYTGAKQSGVPDAQSTNSNSLAAIAGTVTTIADNCWLTGVVAAVGTGLAAGANTTLRGTVSSFTKPWDSNAAITPPASASLNATSSGGTPGFGALVASFAPFVASTGTTAKLTLLGVGR